VHVDNSDGFWTSARGKKAFRARVRNTLRRLKAGHLAKHGLVSIETSSTETTEEQQTGRPSVETTATNYTADTRARAGDHAEPNIFDPWDKCIVPPFPFDILPPGVRRFVETQSVVIGCDPSALAMAALVNFSAALDHRFALKLMRNGDWWASPRLWVLLVGDP